MTEQPLTGHECPGDPCIIVIFGASGDLNKRKLLPALYNLKALKLLPADQREALVLVGAAGMSYEEAAEVAQCAVGTIKSRVNRARIKLTEMLGMTEADVYGPDAATVAIVEGGSTRKPNA